MAAVADAVGAALAGATANANATAPSGNSFLHVDMSTLLLLGSTSRLAILPRALISADTARERRKTQRSVAQLRFC
jgi:hypothetical protein